MPNQEEKETPVERCRRILEDCLLNTENLCICSETSHRHLNSKIIGYLEKHNYKEFLIENDGSGFSIEGPGSDFMIGGPSEVALNYFAESRKVFDSVSGRFHIIKTSGPDNQRLYEAWPATK